MCISSIKLKNRCDWLILQKLKKIGGEKKRKFLFFPTTEESPTKKVHAKQPGVQTSGKCAIVDFLCGMWIFFLSSRVRDISRLFFQRALAKM